MPIRLDIEQRARVQRDLTIDEIMRMTYIEILMADEAIRFYKRNQYSIDYTEAELEVLNRLIHGPYENSDVCMLP